MLVSPTDGYSSTSPDVLVVSEQGVMIRFHLCPSHDRRAFQESVALHALNRYLCHDTERT